MFLATRSLGGLVVALLCAPTAGADAGVVVGSAVAHGWRVSLLASPWPLRAGPAEFSVLLQDAATREPVLDAELALDVHLLDPARAPVAPIRVRAVRGAGGNPLLHSARLELPVSGRWRVVVGEVDASLPALAGIEVEVAPGASLLARHGVALSLPFVGLALFGLHQHLSRRLTCRS